jgi:hypothetical protein
MNTFLTTSLASGVAEDSPSRARKATWIGRSTGPDRYHRTPAMASALLPNEWNGVGLVMGCACVPPCFQGVDSPAARPKFRRDKRNRCCSQVPGPGAYGAPSLPSSSMSGGRFNTSKPKSDVDWAIIRARELPVGRLSDTLDQSVELPAPPSGTDAPCLL